ncbi:hypothetical protein DYBT9623_03003 [Dyadobacter sp. CECT 9623]|uniref:Cytochrome c domain-containing protein n=1 Tax=Dyadobacter linearis TaxID=2823330 RepID=A0ABM8US16_9BACT|nr:hypothetical protein [Dyadobacter sp. CECT 9623]CAG5070457.1 hypothetical protein DYBT9623_03003 [Dyadobacter sp. CECT 9623]
MKLLLIFLTSIGIFLFSFTPNVNELSPERSFAVMQSDTLKKDKETGLVTDENLYLVKAQCTNCHNSKLILNNRFTRDGWKQKIRWMQQNHNLWDLGETEKPVLDYLEKHYGPTIASTRRAPLKNVKWYKLEQ